MPIPSGRPDDRVQARGCRANSRIAKYAQVGPASVCATPCFRRSEHGRRRASRTRARQDSGSGEPPPATRKPGEQAPAVLNPSLRGCFGLDRCSLSLLALKASCAAYRSGSAAIWSLRYRGRNESLEGNELRGLRLLRHGQWRIVAEHISDLPLRQALLGRWKFGDFEKRPIAARTCPAWRLWRLSRACMTQVTEEIWLTRSDAVTTEDNTAFRKSGIRRSRHPQAAQGGES